MSRSKIDAIAIFGASLLLFLMLSFLSGCKKQNPLERVTLRQPIISDQKCALWKYEKDEWKLKELAPIIECDLSFGLNWGDFEYIRRYYEEVLKTCK